MINEWLKIPYKDHGRDITGCDCWGLVRIARLELRGEELPSYGMVKPGNKFELTHAADAIIHDYEFKQIAIPKTGTIATVWRGALCYHVGIVVMCDCGLGVLETNSKSGARVKRLVDFNLANYDVRYYDND
jgi:hypothetical protein